MIIPEDETGKVLGHLLIKNKRLIIKVELSKDDRAINLVRQVLLNFQENGTMKHA